MLRSVAPGRVGVKCRISAGACQPRLIRWCHPAPGRLGAEAKTFELRAATSLARLWQRQGKRDAARDLRDAKALLDDLT
jgi:hypothetical protein